MIRQFQRLRNLINQSCLSGEALGTGQNGTYCPLAQDRPYVVKNDILLEVPLLSTKYGGSGEDNSIQPVISGVIQTVPMG
ncbi:hypothetical protein ACLKA6_009734 [Drosophila palustris]